MKRTKLIPLVAAGVLIAVLAVAPTLKFRPAPITVPDTASTESLTAETLSAEGLGAARFGMTLEDLQGALNTSLSRRGARESEECWYSHAVEQPNAQVLFMMNNDRLVRIDVRDIDDANVKRVETNSGFSVGAAERAVIDFYGRDLEKQPHRYLGDDGSYLRIKSPDGNSALLFETDHGKVQRIRAGLAPAVDYVEGCS